VEGGIGCGAHQATDTRRGLLADLAFQDFRATRTELSLVERPAPAPDERRTDLFDEVRAACAHVKAQIAQFGPELAQSGLLAILELRLPDTYSHARRVARASVALARAMGMLESDVRIVRHAALLHDIGKIAIPGRLLRYRGPLGDHEITALRMHVTIGADLVADAPGLEGVAPVIATTHERYDGTGYPNRLAGDEIPAAARIIAVADCYDAMVIRRPYCEPVSREEAHNEMVRCSGTHFDPAVVREWIAMLGTWGCPVTVARRHPASAIEVQARR